MTSTDNIIGRRMACWFGGVAMAAFLSCGAWAQHHVTSPQAPEPLPVTGDIAALSVKESAPKIPEGTARLHATLNGMGYDLASVAGGRDVPRVFLAQLPTDLHAVGNQDVRKAVFVRTLLPLVLAANERLSADHARIVALRKAIKDGGSYTTADVLWVEQLARDYGVAPNNLQELQRRVDVVPPSLAIAQAVLESGWGTSRFAQRGNALFGHTTEVGGGMRPHGREAGEGVYDLRRFATLGEAVNAYIRNLNTHRAYSDLRGARAFLRSKDKPVDGLSLANALESYSESGADYVKGVRSIIRANDLNLLDGAHLSGLSRSGSREDRAS